MRALLLSAVLVLCMGLTMAQNEKETVKQVVQSAYIEGLQNEGDLAKIEAGFHPDFKLLGVGKDGKMWQYAIGEWKQKQAKKREEGKLPLTGDELVTAKYQSIDITGNAAVVKLDYYKGSTKAYTDYLSLYKFPEGWKIVNKTFHKY
ncbi:nuclear transport factor 2 family protein [Sediminicola luteus]|uniref:DUF4440 domain-containing protein n=1 Tax=Sediminicola luteus TaxID=319238 RepID=A0A2A4GD47_9FLAO|nr:nuclear transport factor 2 family protein [Sediminicola luteus]PCE65908.1 hypothetical protein B7P33_00990 [Sediminicola luteus]